jgi:predicted nucleic acid-binding protein
MLMADVNILVYAHREESPEHQRYADWLVGLASGPELSLFRN